MPGTPAIAAPVPPRRLEFIDLLRGWAVIVMIETHVVNATLPAALTGTAAFGWLVFVNGLVAPSFLFASGLAFAVALRRKAPDLLAGGPALRRLLFRLLLILVVGYILHLPVFSLAGLLHHTAGGEWLSFFQVDVLQCIAVSLLVLLLLLLALRTEMRFALGAAVTAAGVIFAAPVVWSVDFLPHMPAAIAAYANGLHGSLFPLFPWSGFLLAGAVTGYGTMRAREADGSGEPVHQRRFMRAAAVTGAGLLLLAYPVWVVGDAVFPSHPVWRAGPGFVLLRLGLVILLMTGMYLYERRAGVSPRSVVTLLGRESLLVYVLHLLLIYGDFGPFNFQRAVGRSFGYGEAAAVTVLLLLLCYATARIWVRLKKGSAGVRRAAIGVLVMVVVVLFLITPAR